MTETRDCKYEPCSKPFTPTHWRQEFCEPKCRNDHHYAAHPEKGRAVPGSALPCVAGPRLVEPTDWERVLLALRAMGPKGVHSRELRTRHITGNPSQRIAELEERGYEIEHVREHIGRRPGTRYFLISEPEQSSAGSSADASSGVVESVSVGPGGTPAPPEQGNGSPEGAASAPPASGESVARLFDDDPPSQYNPYGEAA